MAKPKLSAGQKRLETDLWIILLCTLAALGAYMVLQDWVTAFMEDKSTTILLRVVVPAMFQFGIAGLGISVVSIIRKESFLSFGLRKKGTLASVVLCILCVVPYTIFKVETGAADRYLP